MARSFRQRNERKAEIPVVWSGALRSTRWSHRGLASGMEIKITPKEFELLSSWRGNAIAFLTHKQILTAVWGPAEHRKTPNHLALLYRPNAA